MKKTISILCMISILISTITIAAYADIPNVIISGPESEQDNVEDRSENTGWKTANGFYRPSDEDLTAIGSAIEYPKKTEYIDDYNYGVVQALVGNSAFCYDSPDMLGSKYTVADGTELVIIAKRGQMLCAVIPTLNKARWFREANVRVVSESEMSKKNDMSGDESKETWKKIYALSDYGYSSTETEYFYNDDNNVCSFIRHEINMDGTESVTETNRFFDENGIIVNGETRDATTGELVETEIWEYTTDQKVKKVYTYDWTGTLKAEQSNRYYDDGYIIEYIRYDDNGGQISRSINQFDLDGYELLTEYYNEFDELRDKTQTFYNSDKEKEREISYNAVINTRNIKNYTYLYDREGRPAEATGTYSEGNLAGKTEVSRYSYDEYGNLIQETRYYDGKETYHASYRWALLENGKVLQVSE